MSFTPVGRPYPSGSSSRGVGQSSVGGKKEFAPQNPAEASRNRRMHAMERIEKRDLLLHNHCPIDEDPDYWRRLGRTVTVEGGKLLARVGLDFSGDSSHDTTDTTQQTNGVSGEGAPSKVLALLSSLFQAAIKKVTTAKGEDDNEHRSGEGSGGLAGSDDETAVYDLQRNQQQRRDYSSTTARVAAQNINQNASTISVRARDVRGRYQGGGGGEVGPSKRTRAGETMAAVDGNDSGAAGVGSASYYNDDEMSQYAVAGSDFGSRQGEGEVEFSDDDETHEREHNNYYGSSSRSSPTYYQHQRQARSTQNHRSHRNSAAEFGASQQYQTTTTSKKDREIRRLRGLLDASAGSDEAFNAPISANARRGSISTTFLSDASQGGHHQQNRRQHKRLSCQGRNPDESNRSFVSSVFANARNRSTSFSSSQHDARPTRGGGGGVPSALVGAARYGAAPLLSTCSPSLPPTLRAPIPNTICNTVLPWQPIIVIRTPTAPTPATLAPTVVSSVVTKDTTASSSSALRTTQQSNGISLPTVKSDNNNNKNNNNNSDKTATVSFLPSTSTTENNNGTSSNASVPSKIVAEPPKTTFMFSPGAPAALSSSASSSSSAAVLQSVVATAPIIAKSFPIPEPAEQKEDNREDPPSKRAPRVESNASAPKAAFTFGAGVPASAPAPAPAPAPAAKAAFSFGSGPAAAAAPAAAPKMAEAPKTGLGGFVKAGPVANFFEEDGFAPDGDDEKQVGGSAEAPAPAPAAKAAFSFASGPTATPAAVNPFAAKEDAKPATTANPFSFGGGGASASPTTDAPKPSFSFGAPAAAAAPKAVETPKAAFTFGAGAPSPAPAPAAKAAFSFGSGPAAAAAPAAVAASNPFAATPAAVNPFAAKEDAKPATTANPFSFGGGGGGAPAAPSNPFSFGGANPFGAK